MSHVSKKRRTGGPAVVDLTTGEEEIESDDEIEDITPPNLHNGELFAYDDHQSTHCVSLYRRRPTSTL